jgi:GNAT superfamily N-acetyltransferase
MVGHDIDAPPRIQWLESAGWSYKIVATVSNTVGGMRIHAEVEVNGDWIDLTDGIFFSVILCRCY